MIPLKKPLPGDVTPGKATTDREVTAAEETADVSGRNPVTAPAADTTGDDVNALTPNKKSYRPLIILLLVIAVVLGIYFMFFNKKENKWIDFDDDETWESVATEEALEYFEDF